MGMILYRYEMIGANRAGEDRHPQLVIREIAPEARNFEPVTIADCWMFEAPEILDPPPFVVRVRDTEDRKSISDPLGIRGPSTPEPRMSVGCGTFMMTGAIRFDPVVVGRQYELKEIEIMSIDYASHYTPKTTPQTEQADARQVENAAGGQTFVVSPLKLLERFLVLGADGGSYHVGERELVRENAKNVIACLETHGVEAVEMIAHMSESGRAPKNSPAIFALALAASHKIELKNDSGGECSGMLVREAALRALPRVCRTGTHLFEFVGYVRKMRGLGRAVKRAISAWYEDKPLEWVSYQVTKYRQRGGMSNRDVFRLVHPDARKGAPSVSTFTKRGHDVLFRYVTDPGNLGERIVKRGRGLEEPSVISTYAAVQELPAYLSAFEELQRTDSARRVYELVEQYRFTHEMIPSAHLKSPVVWDVLAERMPMTALVRNLGRLTSLGVLAPLSLRAKLIAERISSADELRAARVHPFALLLASKVYGRGAGEKGSLTWSPVREIVDALDAGFYESFSAVVPTGKNFLLAIDVSGSMRSTSVAGSSLINSATAAACLAMVIARSEKHYHCVAFSSGVPGEWKIGTGRSRWTPNFYAGLTELSISPRQRIGDVMTAMDAIQMGGTDCAIPMLYAMDRGLEVDCFVVLTDNETWSGDVHPHQALARYRERSGKRDARLAVIAFESSAASIADPSDPRQADFVGFDASGPEALASFAAI